MKKLELNHLAPYLPYGLKILNGWGDVKTLNYTHLNDENNGFITMVKPILRPLSEVEYYFIELWESKDEETREFMDVDFLEGYGHLEISYIKITEPKYLPVGLYNLLLKHHFDIFDLIEKGLAIDINTIKEKC